MIDLALYIWAFGKWAVITSFLGYIGLVLFWVIRDRQGVVYDFDTWEESTTEKLFKTYFYAVSSYLLFLFSMVKSCESTIVHYFLSTEIKTSLSCAILILAISTYLQQSLEYIAELKTKKQILFMVHSTILGPIFAYFGRTICSESASLAALGLALATLAAFTAPKKFYIDLEEIIKSTNAIVSLSSILAIMFGPPYSFFGTVLVSVSIYGGMMLYFAVFIVNTQYMIEEMNRNKDHYDPIFTAAVLFLCTANLLLRISLFYAYDLVVIHK